jgi:hypothetical protein
MTFSGRMTKNNADVQSTVAPIISRRKPNHSFAATLWNAMRAFLSMQSRFPWKEMGSSKHGLGKHSTIFTRF